LGSVLERQLQINFTPGGSVTQVIAYRVTVGKDGKVVDYRPHNTAAEEFVNLTPLPMLRYNPVPGLSLPTDPIASLRATFFPNGRVKVTPWNAPAPQASASPSPSPEATVANS
jgi:hypothetical protein